mmetsp:Transcript_59585/g.139442  ORF Transcript_59585/g.139442 Transcript_59585/m.139442 type:complete len:149 (-) Transcript_59585:699-1145(-)
MQLFKRYCGYHELPPVELASTAWAVARLAFHDSHDLLAKIVDAATPKLPEFTARNLANISWAFAAIRFVDQTFFTAISAQMIKCLSDFGAQSLSNSAWAFARLLIVDVPLLSALSRRSFLLLPEFSMQNLSNMAWSCAALVIADLTLV